MANDPGASSGGQGVDKLLDDLAGVLAKGDVIVDAGIARGRQTGLVGGFLRGDGTDL